MESSIDWDNAPEGATHYMPESEMFSESWIKDVTENSYWYILTSELEADWDKARFSRPKAAMNLIIKKAEAKPIYTQAMADNGELPGVGMECLILYSSSNYKGTITYMGKGVGVYHSKDNDKEYTFSLNSVSFKALKPPVELVDGEAYVFESSQYGGGIGFYNSDNCRFININMSIRADSCTNIKHLT